MGGSERGSTRVGRESIRGSERASTRVGRESMRGSERGSTRTGADRPSALDIPAPSTREPGRVPGCSTGRVFSLRVGKLLCTVGNSRLPPKRFGDSMPRDGPRCTLKRETPYSGDTPGRVLTNEPRFRYPIELFEPSPQTGVPV